MQSQELMQITFFSDNIVMDIGMFISFILFLFLGFLFLTFVISLFKKEYKSRRWDKDPAVSIIIPAYNEEKNIYLCLESVARSDYPKRLMEILVVDDASNDNTLSEIERFRSEHKAFDIKIIKGSHQGKSESLNKGIKLCKNELIITIDADVELGKDTIKKLLWPMADPAVGATNSVAIITNPHALRTLA